MTKKKPQIYQKQSIINFRTGQPIRGEDWKNLADQQNRSFQQICTEFGNWIWRPPATTSSDTYTQVTDDAQSKGLGQFNLGGTIERKLSNNQVLLGMETFGFDVDARVTFVNEATSTTLGSVVTSHGSTSDWLPEYAYFSRSDVVDSNGNPQFIRAVIDFRRGPSSGTATWIAFRIGGNPRVSVSDIPSADAI